MVYHETKFCLIYTSRCILEILTLLSVPLPSTVQLIRSTKRVKITCHWERLNNEIQLETYYLAVKSNKKFLFTKLGSKVQWKKKHKASTY